MDVMDYTILVLMLSWGALVKVTVAWALLYFSFRFIFTPIYLHKLNKMDGDNDKLKVKESFEKDSRLYHKVVFSAWLIIVATILFINATSPAALPKIEDDSGSSLSHIEAYNAKKEKRLENVEINDDNAKNPMKFSGDESKKRILELTDYKNKKFSSEDEDEVIDPEELTRSTTGQEPKNN